MTGWSAPASISLGGLGGGFEIGLDLTDFVIILNSKRALMAFCKGGNVTLGGALSGTHTPSQCMHS